MVKRRVIGFPFSYNTGWIAGVYYIVNIVRALDLLDDKLKPAIQIYYIDEELLYLIKDVNYPYLKFVKQSTSKNRKLLVRVINKIVRSFTGSNIIENRLKDKSIDVLFPASDDYFFQFIQSSKRKYWIPDFQEHFLPQFFSSEEVFERKSNQKFIINKGSDVVLSSYSAEKNFQTIYPLAKNKTSVIRFCVFHEDDYKNLDIENLKVKYGLPDEYFFCANQFWAHKNHIVIFKALSLLKEKGISKTIVCSGSKNDYRNPDFFTSLIEYISSHDIIDNIKFVGFIERDEQLCLLQNSVAIIQPSLFEGWSTVVEDSKALNKHIILSDLDIHREQIDQNVTFFNPQSIDDLASVLRSNSFQVSTLDYYKEQEKFANNLSNILCNTQVD